MAVSTGLLAVITAPAGVSFDRVGEAVSFASECREIMRTVIASDQNLEGPAVEERTWYFPATAPLMAAPVPRLTLLSDVAVWAQHREGEPVRLVMTLDPLRLPTDPLVVFECLQRMIINGLADGIVGVVRGADLIVRDEWLEPAAPGALALDLSVFMIRHLALDEAPADWLKNGRFLPYELAPAGSAPRGGLL
jgi:hypothetical protein